jgi:hypothetical protein
MESLRSDLDLRRGFTHRLRGQLVFTLALGSSIVSPSTTNQMVTSYGLPDLRLMFKSQLRPQLEEASAATCSPKPRRES